MPDGLEAPELDNRQSAFERMSLALRAVVAPYSSPIRVRLARGAAWSVLDTGFRRGFALIISIVVARTLGREHFGQFGLVQGTVGVFAIFAGFGMSVTATKFVAELRESDPKKAGRILGLTFLVAAVGSTSMTAVLFAIAPWLARTTLASPEVGSLLRLGCGLLFFGVLNGAVVGALYGFEGFKPVAIVDAVAGLVGCSVIIVGVLKRGLPGAVVGLVASVGLQCLGYCFFLRRELNKNGIAILYSHCFDEWPVLMKFSVPALLAVALTGPVSWICSTIIVNQPAGYSQLGLFNAANQWFSVVMLLPLTMSAPFLPVLTSLANREPAKYFKVLWTGIALNTTLALVAAAGVILFSGMIMRSYGKDFLEGVPVLVWLVLAACISAAVWSVGQAITSSGKMWWGTTLNLIWGVTLISALWLLRREGAYGYALATLIAYSVHLLTSMFVYSRIRVQLSHARGAGE
jgi:O-antigen/teichoic acid export membrane protein